MSQVSIHGAEKNVFKIFNDEYAFTIPLYQRPYSWTTEHAGDLLDDFLGFIRNEGNVEIKDMKPYFLGSIVLIKGESPDSKIVDGQQRLVTLTILLSALRHTIQGDYAKGITKYIYEEGDKLIGTPDHFRITLRERDAPFFQKYIQETNGIKKLIESDLEEFYGEKNSISDTMQNIYDNARLYVSHLEALSEIERINLASFLLTKCYLVVVTTPDFDSAYNIFSILNNRGLELTFTDILKADLIGKISPRDQEKYAQWWDNTEEMLGRDLFQELFSHIRTINRKIKQQDTVLKEFKKFVLNNVDSKEFIDNVVAPYSNAFFIIKNSKYMLGDGSFEDLNSLLKWLNRIDNSDWVPPAMTYFSKNWKNPDKLAHFFGDLERLAVCLLILHANINKRMERYSPLLSAIEKDEDLFNPASPLQLTMQERRECLHILNGDIYSNKKVHKDLARYVLLRLDTILSEGSAVYDYPIVTVEHVLPQNPAPGSIWEEWFSSQKEHKKYVNRLGNLVLLSRKKNSGASNYDFEKKKSSYFATRKGISPFVLTTKILENNEWTPEVIESRQDELIGILKKTWRL
ncbi:MAG TPA: DUF262 domain-containing HNH endonuclease family protein [Methanothrix sp.]|nr:DUF262 domain-containing HNH endonuclease family protein [Methanothrix sp.]